MITRLSIWRDVLPAVAHADMMSAVERLVERGCGIGLVPTPGNSQVVAIGDPELLRLILALDETPDSFTNRGGEFYAHLKQRGPNNEPGDVLDGGPFTQTDSCTWKRTRSAAKMTNTRDVTESLLRHFAQLLREQQGVKKIDLLELLKKSFIHALSLRLFGLSMQEIGQARLASYAPEYFGHMAWQLLFALLPGKKGFGRKKYAQTGQALGSVLDEMIDAARDNPSQLEGSLLAQLLNEFDVSDSAERQIIKGTLGTEVMAGFDSVGVVVTQACHELAKNQQLQEELRIEGFGVSQRKPILASMLRTLHKTKAFWRLSLHKTPAFRVIFRNVSHEHILKVVRGNLTVEHCVKPGDQLLLVLSGAHLPYGEGERECMGKSFAEMAGPLLIATLLQHCVISLPRLRLPGVALAMTSPLRSTSLKVKWL